jgi:sulfate permease, SulP family
MKALFSNKNVVGDLLGGLTAAIVALPISLAFGVASGLGPAAGLYGAIACGILAAAFGGTPGQVSGPTGPMTVVVTAMFAAHPDKPHLVFAAVFLGGLIQMLLGRIHAGQLITYVPYPVISGFMTGIGVIIILLQLRPLVGLPSEGNVLDALQDLGQLVHGANLHAVYTGALTLATIYGILAIWKRLPAPLIALAVGSAAVMIFNWQVPVIGEIPRGLPLPKIPLFAFHDLNIVLMNALSLAVLGSIDSLLTSVVMDRIRKTRHDSDKELIGQGLGNMLSGLIGGLPGAGATMRSVINVRSGGHSNLSGIVHGVILLAVLLWLGPYASRIPQACLAAILITVGISIIDYRGMKAMRKAPREDVIVMCVVLALTVFVDLIIAVGVGVTLASTLFAKKLSDASLTKVGTVDTVAHLVDAAAKLPESVRAGMYIYSFSGPLFFGEIRNFTRTIDSFTDPKYIILRFSGVPFIDQTAAYGLEDAVERWRAKGIPVIFTGMLPVIKGTLENLGVLKNDDGFQVFDSTELAIETIAEQAAAS